MSIKDKKLRDKSIDYFRFMNIENAETSKKKLSGYIKPEKKVINLHDCWASSRYDTYMYKI